MKEFNPNLVIDAAEGVLGRVASLAAKNALKGKTVAVVNSEKALLTGNKKMILDKYKEARARGGTSLKGPNFPKEPSMLMKRTVRGMLSYKQGRGADAFENVRCFVGFPKEYEKLEKISLKKDLRTKSITVGELCRIM